ncbi:MAG: hypothetical protein OXF82_10505 [Gammaproteobacteria bacterium]|nr:hypothetical protein [Gammaproteobacteria bacterium]
MNKLIIALGLILGLAAPVSVSAQEVEYPAAFNEPMPLLDEAMGDFHYPVSTASELAQRYFDQGFQLMYGFAKIEAARSFHASRLADPDCAICYWGEAWAWGSYLNGAMTVSEAPRALAMARRALELIDNASPKEADLIRAIQVRYIEDYDPQARRAQDEHYRDAMAELAEKYPDDLDIVTLYADALFLLEERRGYRSLENPNTAHLHNVLLSVIDRKIDHPGACHLFVHATESTPTPELAAPCARHLGDTIPGASHINHMPSHTWNEMGLWHEAVRANVKAWHSDQKAAHNRSVSTYAGHNLTMLYYAGAMGGESAASLQAARDLAALNGNTAMLTMALVRFGRFDEIIQVGEPPAGEVNRAMYDFSHGYAALKLGDNGAARQTVEELKERAATTTSRFRFHDGKDIIATLAHLLEGEIHWLAGEREAALGAFREAVDNYDKIGYDEPEPLPFSPRHWLGALHLEMGATNNALAEYRQDLTEHPNNIWALWGIQQALRAQGQNDPEIDAKLEDLAQHADIWLPATKF